MAAPQGLFQFAGAQALFSGSFTLATGISPSVCTLSVAPGARSLRIGPLVLSYGGVRMVWRDCIVDKVEAVVGDDGFTTWQLSILDRRWKWRGLGRISGNYNTRVGGLIDDTTRKSARQLVDLCLKELEERNAVTAEVPTDIFPEVEWDYEPPAEAMAKLCDELGLVVVLDVTDRVRVMRKGSGPPLPNLPSVISYEQTVDPPEVPSSIVIVGGPTRYSTYFDLEAVGLEENGKIVPIDELSYKPVDGWANVDVRSFYQVAKRSRPLAQQSVFRWYRIKMPCVLPGVKGLVEELSRILPTDPDSIERIIEDQDKPSRINASVFGVFYNGLDDFGVWVEGKEDVDGDELGRSVSPDNFDIDTEKGVVKFSNPMYQLYVGTGRTGTAGIAPADISLSVACSLRDKENRSLMRHHFGDSRGPTTRYIVRDELTVMHWQEFDFAKNKFVLKNNIKALQPLVAKIRRQVEAEYSVQTPASAMYDGIVPISPSGAVPSVSWSISDNGRSMTQASIHVEDLRQPVPSRAESRFAERARAENARKRNKRAEREQLKRGR